MSTLFSSVLPPESAQQARERANQLRGIILDIEDNLADAFDDEERSPQLLADEGHKRWKRRAEDALFHANREFKFLESWLLKTNVHSNGSRPDPDEGQNDHVTLLLVAYQKLSDLQRRVEFTANEKLLLAELRRYLEFEGVNLSC